jgi:hypothetical protein
MGNAAKQLVRRCPRLGGPVDFFYCKTCEPQRHPCRKIIDCWWETFDVQRYLQDHLAPAILERLTTKKPEPKLSQLVKIAARSKKRLAEK